MTIPILLLTPRRNGLLAGHDNEVEVLVRVQAPSAPAGAIARQPLHLALVIDRSGSMHGEPLEHARRCAEFMLDSLHETDRLSVVAFDARAELLAPAARLHDKGRARHAIRQIREGGNTDLHGGWFQGAESLAPHTDDRVVSRAILLSDGNANAGLTRQDRIFEQCAALAETGVTTSTYGLGRAFNEELMIGMAKHGGGHAYYGSTAADLMDPFREEFAVLESLCARQLRLQVEPCEGVEVAMLNDYLPAESGAAGRAWRLPDLAFSGEAWAVLRLRVTARELEREAGAIPVLNLRLHYTGRDGEPRAIDAATLRIPPVAESAFDAIAEDDLVARRVGELEAARLQELARISARAGNWAQVEASLNRASVFGDSNPWVRDSVAELRALSRGLDPETFGKASAYQSHRMQSRLAAQDESGESHLLQTIASYLRRKTHQGRGDEPKQP
jgi:Ca-activated chloride channel family protein